MPKINEKQNLFKFTYIDLKNKLSTTDEKKKYKI